MRARRRRREGGPPAGGQLQRAQFFQRRRIGGRLSDRARREDPRRLLRQKAKIVSAIRQLDADVLGLMELENDGFGPQSAVKELVDALNAGQAADKQYRFVDPGLPKIGTDAITTGMLYRPSRVKPDGAAQALTVGDPGKNRLSLAQTSPPTARS